MKIKNTMSRNKIIRFADAFIEVPASSEWLVINNRGIVFALRETPNINFVGDAFDFNGESVELSGKATMVANVEDFGGAHVIKIEDLMAGL